MKKMMIFFLLVSTPHAYSLVTDYASHGPMQGWTIKPAKEHFYISTYFQYLHTGESFNANGDLLTLKEQMRIPNVDPSLYKTTLMTDISLGLTRGFGVQVVVPYIVEYEFRANTETGNNEQDLIGDTGFGDVDVGVWFAATPFSDVSVLFSGTYHIMSGTSPYVVTSGDGVYGSNQPFSTGIGYSYLRFSVASDVMLLPFFSVSLFAGYQVNQTFSDDGYRTISKMGNVATLGARGFFSYKNLFFSLGVHNAFSADHYEQDIKRRGSGFNILTLLPQFGFAVPAIRFIDSVHLGYSAPLSGKNTTSPRFITLGVDIKI